MRVITCIGLSTLILSACTTIPEPSKDFARNGASLSSAKGIRTKRLAAPPPNPPIAQDAVLFIRQVGFSRSIVNSSRIDDAQRALVSNALARHACSDLSRLFEISSSDTVEGAYWLQMTITRLTPTGRAGAIIGNATGLLSPMGVRPPIGLGELTVEFELVKPDGALATGMVWTQRADIISSDASISTIGDAYAFTETASSDFAALVQGQTPAQQAGERLRRTLGSTPDPACAAYGKANNVLGRFLPLPPNMVDKGPKP